MSQNKSFFWDPRADITKYQLYTDVTAGTEPNITKSDEVIAFKILEHGESTTPEGLVTLVSNRFKLVKSGAHQYTALGQRQAEKLILERAIPFRGCDHPHVYIAGTMWKYARGNEHDTLELPIMHYDCGNWHVNVSSHEIKGEAYVLVHKGKC